MSCAKYDNVNFLRFLQVLSPVCLSYLSFLAMLRVGDAPMPLMQLAAKFDWDFDMMALLRMNARVKAAAQAFIVGRYVHLV